jgi:pyruvate/2-oxoglutarate dehydrogenase complex dihydrolipoamide acyltransferase (E2) component
MTIRFDRPVSHAAHASRLIAAFALVLCVLVLLGHRFGPLATPNLVLLLLISAGVAAIAVLLAVIGLVQLWQTGAEGGVSAFKALIYAALPLALFGMGAERYIALPELYDVSTDVGNAPQWLKPPHADQIWMPRKPEITPQDRAAQSAAYPALTGRRYEGAADRVLEAVRQVAKESGITITKVEGTGDLEPDKPTPIEPDVPAPPPLPQGGNDSAVTDAPDVVPVPTPRPEEEDEVASLIRRNTDVTLQGETRTRILGLRFDVLIRLHEEAETTLVDIRVASRYGPHDLGFSAGIAEAYLKALDAELLGIAGD